jgi:flavin-dependent dehydrogenase
VRARILVAADGVHSTIARRLNLHRPGVLRKIALVAHLRGIEGLSEYGEVHVAGRRYVGLAPLEPTAVGDLCNVAMVVDQTRDGPQLAGRPQAFLLEALESFPRLRGRLGRATVARRTLTTSRICVRARRLVDAGLLLVGDAAGYFDPFTGEGIYQALRSAELAADVIALALSADDVTRSALEPYAARFRQAFKGKRTVEAIVQSSVQVPMMMDRIAHTLARRTAMADTIVAVTGDFLPPSAVLNPGFLLRLLA